MKEINFSERTTFFERFLLPGFNLRIRTKGKPVSEINLDKTK